MPYTEVLHKFKQGALHTGSKSGPVVKSRKQAIAIMLSEKRAAAGGKSEYRADSHMGRRVQYGSAAHSPMQSHPMVGAMKSGWPERKNYMTTGGVYTHNSTQAPLGEGGRFAALKAKIAKRGSVRDPSAVAAAIGRKKYGTARFQKLAAAGRKG